MKLTSLLLLALLGCCACSGGGPFGPNPDSCPDSDGRSTTDSTRACQVWNSDGGVAPGVDVRCTNNDAGAVTDDSGNFTIADVQATCGIGAGRTACGALAFSRDGGTLKVLGPDSTEPETTVFGGLQGSGCLIRIVNTP